MSKTSGKSIGDSEVNAAFDLAKKVIDECGPRMPGSEAATKAAEILYEEVKKYDSSARKEAFTFAPNAFFGFFNIMFVGYMIIIPLLFIGGDWLYLAAVVGLVTAFWAISQFVFYWGLFDIFYKKKKGHNVIANVEPNNPADVKQEIIVCGHHDSAWVIHFLTKMQKLYSVRLIVGIGFVLIVVALTLIWAIYHAFTGMPIFYDKFVQYGSIVGIFFVIQLIFYRDKHKATPGAGDNMISSTMAVIIGKVLADAKKSGNSLLKNTRVKIISFDAEEAATKGSKAYAKLHKDEFKNIPVYALCPDCINQMRDLAILNNDQNGSVQNDPQLIADCVQIAKEFGYEVPVHSFGFGGGATDGAPLARAGAKTMTFMGMSTQLIRDDLYYHTPEDTLDHVDHDIVEAIMKIMFEYILRKDKMAK